MLKHFENVQLKWLFITVKSHRRRNLSPLLALFLSIFL
jgi:hypothetical protein